MDNIPILNCSHERDSEYDALFHVSILLIVTVFISTFFTHYGK